MLRITTDQAGSTTILRLEGWLEGQYVVELRRCRNDVPKEQRIIVDLADIRFVAPAGKALLVEMFQASAEIVACDALTPAIRDDVTGNCWTQKVRAMEKPGKKQDLLRLSPSRCSATISGLLLRCLDEE